jgi:hypothetical protein
MRKHIASVFVVAFIGLRTLGLARKAESCALRNLDDDQNVVFLAETCRDSLGLPMDECIIRLPRWQASISLA